MLFKHFPLRNILPDNIYVQCMSVVIYLGINPRNQVPLS